MGARPGYTVYIIQYLQYLNEYSKVLKCLGGIIEELFSDSNKLNNTDSFE